MLMLIFYVGSDRYAVECKSVVEVVRLVRLRKPDRAQRYVAGIFQYRNAIVPVIDLCLLMRGEPCQKHLSTRIILVRHQWKATEGIAPVLGLMAERITETIDLDDTMSVQSGLRIDDADYLGEIVTDRHGLIQQVNLENLLPGLKQAL